MLHHCEFNGKKDVLHFKLLQAAISENNAKKACEQNAENLNENLDASRRHVVMNNEMKGNFDYPPDTHKFQFKGNQYRNFDAGASNDYEPRVKKPNVLSDHLDLIIWIRPAIEKENQKSICYKIQTCVELL